VHAVQETGAGGPTRVHDKGTGCDLTTTLPICNGATVRTASCSAAAVRPPFGRDDRLFQNGAADELPVGEISDTRQRTTHCADTFR